MRSVEIVEAFPFVQLGFEFDIAFVAELLTEFLSIRPMRAFHFAVQLGRTALDVGVADAKILDMPMELRLELIVIIRPNHRGCGTETFR